MCEYKALDNLTKECVKEFFKNYVGYNEYHEDGDGNNLSYFFFEYSPSYIKNDEEAIDFLSKNIKDIFEFNKKYEKDENRYKDKFDEDRYENLVEGMELYGSSPRDFLKNYVHWNFCWNYEELVDTLSLSWLNNHESLSEEWYNTLCTVVDNL